MQVKMSEYLTAVKPDMQKLVELLKKDFAYVSVLCTDVTGTTYLVGQRQTSVGDYHFNERGFVVRVYENSCYMEYSFNEYEDIEKLASSITETLKKELHMMEELGIEKMEAPLIHEEKIEKSMTGEIGVDPTSVSPEEILGRLKKISDTGAAGKYVIEFRAAAQFAHVSKLFLSEKKDLMQTYAYAEGMAAAIGVDGEKQDMVFRGFSGLKGAELLDEIEGSVDDILKMLDDKLHADSVVPGMYDVITAPEITGLIAHEAFGHGVEMDMFVKERALAKEYVGKKVASDITSMKDGAASAAEVSSYLFDDEGNAGNRHDHHQRRNSRDRYQRPSERSASGNDSHRKTARGRASREKPTPV